MPIGVSNAILLFWTKKRRKLAANCWPEVDRKWNRISCWRIRHSKIAKTSCFSFCTMCSFWSRRFRLIHIIKNYFYINCHFFYLVMKFSMKFSQFWSKFCISIIDQGSPGLQKLTIFALTRVKLLNLIKKLGWKVNWSEFSLMFVISLSIPSNEISWYKQLDCQNHKNFHVDFNGV